MQAAMVSFGLLIFAFIPLSPHVHFSTYIIFHLKFQLTTKKPTLTTWPQTLCDASASRCFQIPFHLSVG